MQTDPPPWLREIDHTGDVGLAITAPDLATLYARAARGMFWVLTDVEAVRPRESMNVDLDAPDREALMVRWLSELNYIHATQNWLFRRFDVAVASAPDATSNAPDAETGVRLHATCHGEPVDRSRHTIYTEIKAVTFHDLHVESTDDGWTVQVIFDM